MNHPASKVSDATLSEWKTYWPLVLAAAVGFSFHSVMTYSTGLFISPLGKEFGWSRTQVTAGLTVAAILTVPLSPFVGMLIDRWGARRLAVPGLVVTALSIASFGLANGSWFQWIGLWVAYALVAMSIKSTVWSFAVASAFAANRGLAFAFVLSGVAIAQTIAPPLTNFLIEQFGWRNAYFWLAAGWGAPAFVLVLAFQVDTRQPARPTLVRQPAGADAAYQGLTLREALRDPALIRIGLATLITMMLGIGVIVHQVPILEDAGVPRRQAAYLASLAGLAGIFGKLATGWLMDRMHGARVGGVTLALSAIAFFLLLEPIRTPALIVVAVIVIGYATGAKLQVTTYLTSRYAGMRNFGAIYGTMSSVVALGAGLGPSAAALVYDHFGSYTPLLIAGVPGSLLCGFLIFGLGPYPVWEHQS